MTHKPLPAAKVKELKRYLADEIRLNKKSIANLARAKFNDYSDNIYAINLEISTLTAIQTKLQSLINEAQDDAS